MRLRMIFNNIIARKGEKSIRKVGNRRNWNFLILPNIGSVIVISKIYKLLYGFGENHEIMALITMMYMYISISLAKAYCRKFIYHKPHDNSDNVLHIYRLPLL